METGNQTPRSSQRSASRIKNGRAMSNSRISSRANSRANSRSNSRVRSRPSTANTNSPETKDSRLKFYESIRLSLENKKLLSKVKASPKSIKLSYPESGVKFASWPYSPSSGEIVGINYFIIPKVLTEYTVRTDNVIDHTGTPVYYELEINYTKKSLGKVYTITRQFVHEKTLPNDIFLYSVIGTPIMLPSLSKINISVKRCDSIIPIQTVYPTSFINEHLSSYFTHNIVDAENNMSEIITKHNTFGVFVETIES